MYPSPKIAMEEEVLLLKKTLSTSHVACIKQASQLAKEFRIGRESIWYCILLNQLPLSMRAARVLEFLAEDQLLDLSLEVPYILDIFEKVSTEGGRRSLMHILWKADYSYLKHYEARLFDLSRDLALSASEGVAAKCYAMYILGRITQKHTEMKHELLFILEKNNEHGTPAMKATIRKIQKSIKAL